MIAGVDAANEASIRFHEGLGFEKTGHLREVGHKFDRWLDLVFPAEVDRAPVDSRDALLTASYPGPDPCECRGVPVAAGGGTFLTQYFALWPSVGPTDEPSFQPWQLLTYGFMHGGFLDIFFNMYALYMFGSRWRCSGAAVATRPITWRAS